MNTRETDIRAGTTTGAQAATLHYIFDPLCGWCYAASPLIREVVDTASSNLTLQFHPGLLFASEREIDMSYREHIISADQRIAALAGVSFGDAYIKRVRNAQHLWYHSAPPAAAIMAVAALQPESALNMLEAIQHAHYVLGEDVTDATHLQQLAVSVGVAAEVFDSAFNVALEYLPQQAEVARALLQASGGGGFPTFVLSANDRQIRLDHGSAYGKPDLMIASLNRALQELATQAP